VPKGGARVVGTIGRNASEAVSPAPNAAQDNGIPKLQGAQTPAKPTKTPNKPAPKPKPKPKTKN